MHELTHELSHELPRRSDALTHPRTYPNTLTRTDTFLLHNTSSGLEAGCTKVFRLKPDKMGNSTLGVGTAKGVWILGLTPSFLCGEGEGEGEGEGGWGRQNE